ncbi:MAG: molybdopterin converting factor subunit 1 [Aliifodinibius sp.]|nr:molybdopterin converting factor subunit 1 [Fodinibius sp.]
MKITIKFFASSRELVGRNQLEMKLPSDATVKTLIDTLKQNHVKLAKLNSFMIAVNMEYVKSDVPLNDGDEVAIIPPVSGG